MFPVAAARRSGRKGETINTPRDSLALCVLNCFVSGAPDIHSYPGRATRISAEAARLLTTRPMIRGEPVEAVVGPHEHFAGLVTFCRSISVGIYEVGVQILDRACRPILAGDRPDWVAEALRASHGLSAPRRRSA